MENEKQKIINGQDLAKEMLALPITMKGQALQVIETESVLENLKEKLIGFENVVLFDVVQEKDDKGKPKFSNEKMRTAEISRRLMTLESYSNLKEELKDLKKKNLQKKEEYLFHQRRFSAIKVVLNFLTADE